MSTPSDRRARKATRPTPPDRTPIEACVSKLTSRPNRREYRMSSEADTGRSAMIASKIGMASQRVPSAG